ncbi:HD domain-containing protein [Phyllobacterium myrsinacearum]|uniref:HD-CE domain-containing protein n=1 Tax=Phyllobacterium myrsinacearum TaxID=28101 RepID=A0A839EWH3_9HYPH|nr:ATP-binding protein [Phyllobacterium myrsinacearum]MBA8880870.1 hypothetical protein [Phyllobacterium myrsinacearum]
MSFERSRLYSEAFLQDSSEFDSTEQNFFMHHLASMRARVEPIAARILRDMSGYTVHDITHLDALWEMASLVAGDNLTLNPPEAFVFGGAILLHDASMTLAAYPGGLDELKQLNEWKDMVALGTSGDNVPDEAYLITNVLRMLHAKNAEKLATQSWSNASTDPEEFLIQDGDLRRYYGATIGQIAHSHWWPISSVATKLNSYLGPLPPHTQCGVDRLKIAGLLRVADAIHLDRRRAPTFVRALEQPRGISNLHWAFQNRLSSPRVDGDALQFTAGEHCPIEESESWWLCFDALALADREIRETGLLLVDEGRPSLRVTRIKGVQNPRELALDIPVKGWKPINSPLRISDVPKIVSILGGSSLYGDDWRAPLRELLQNAVDAIHARRIMQNNAVWGTITVQIEERAGEPWLIVEDDGVGMSEHVMTTNLVDFGNSLWRSAAISEEYPGLAARGMSAIGKFGIGFFSVFMIASEVVVTSRRFDAAATDALSLLFKNGVNSRPILAPATRDSVPQNGGTRVELKLFSDPRLINTFKFTIDGGKPTRQRGLLEYSYNIAEPIATDLISLVQQIAPCCDTRIIVKDAEILETAVAPGDWTTCDPLELSRRVITWPSRPLARNLKQLMRPLIKADGETIGRAVLWPSMTYQSQTGALVSGGFKVQMVPHIAGVILGDVEVAARNLGSPITDPEAYRVWATEQAKLVSKTDTPSETQALIAELVLEFGGNCGNLPIAHTRKSWHNKKQLIHMLRSMTTISALVGEPVHEDDDEVSLNSFDDLILAPEIVLIPTISTRFTYDRERVRPSYLLRYFESALKTAWPSGWIDLDIDEVIGDVNGTEIMRPITEYRRNPAPN